jgi:hypothetical protein
LQIAAVRRSCQTMAGASGSPVVLSQITIVSRWLVMPIAAIASDAARFAHRPSRQVSQDFFQISAASCSTQPGAGNAAPVRSG